MYEVDGKEYVVVFVGYGGVNLIWGGLMVDIVKDVLCGGMFYVFVLN